MNVIYLLLLFGTLIITFFGQYNSGNGEVIPTTSDPLHFGSSSLITFPATVSHPHMVLQNGNEILVPDLVSCTSHATVPTRI